MNTIDQKLPLPSPVCRIPGFESSFKNDGDTKSMMDAMDKVSTESTRQYFKIRFEGLVGEK